MPTTWRRCSRGSGPATDIAIGPFRHDELARASGASVIMPRTLAPEIPGDPGGDARTDSPAPFRGGHPDHQPYQDTDQRTLHDVSIDGDVVVSSLSSRPARNHNPVDEYSTRRGDDGEERCQRGGQAGLQEDTGRMHAVVDAEMACRQVGRENPLPRSFAVRATWLSGQSQSGLTLPMRQRFSRDVMIVFANDKT